MQKYINLTRVLLEELVELFEPSDVEQLLLVLLRLLHEVNQLLVDSELLQSFDKRVLQLFSQRVELRPEILLCLELVRLVL